MQPALKDIPLRRSRSQARSEISRLTKIGDPSKVILVEQFVEKLSPKQMLVWELLMADNGVREIFFGGAAGPGKSFLMAFRQVYMRTKYPGTRGMVGRDTIKELKKTILPKINEVAKMVGLVPGEDYTFRETHSDIVWANGSITYLMPLSWQPSDPDYHRIAGLEITDLDVDEGQTVEQRAVQIASSRIRWRNKELGIPEKTLITGNPGPHWLKHTFVKDEEGNPLQLPAHRAFIQAFFYDNPNKDVADAYAMHLDSLGEYDRARLRDGDWDAEERTGGEFYPDFNSEKHIGMFHVEYDPQLPLHLSWDFNVNPYVTCLVNQVKGKRAIQIAEVTLPHPATSRDACRRLLVMYPHHKGGAFLYGDRNGRNDSTRQEQGYNDYTIIQQELAAWRPVMRVQDANPAVHMSGQFVNEIFRVGFGGVSFSVDSACRNTIRDLQNVKRDSDGGMKKTKVKDPKTGVTYEPLGHCADANRYFLTKCFATEYQQFQRGPATFEVITGRGGLSKFSY